MIKKILSKLISQFIRSRIEEPKTVPPLTTTIIVKVGDNVVGAIQNVSIKETPSDAAAPVKVEAHRVRFDRARIAEAFSRGYVHVAAQKYPLQIEVTSGTITTIIQNAWIEAIDWSYVTNDWIIVECMNLVAELVKKK